MSNLTLSIDDDLIKLARVRAIQQGTSLSAKVREFLQQYVNAAPDDAQKQREAATQRLLEAMDKAQSVVPQSAYTVEESQPLAKRTLRDEMYEGSFRAFDQLSPPQ